MALSGKGRTLLFLFLLWLIYITIGLFIFRAVEYDGDKEPGKTKEQLLEETKLNITAKYNMSKADFDSLVQKIEEAWSSIASGPQWGYAEALSFVVQLVTTIGKLVNLKLLRLNASFLAEIIRITNTNLNKNVAYLYYFN